METLIFDTKFNDYLEIVNEALIQSLPKVNFGQDVVVKAMNYSIINGGKRIRPILVLAFANCFNVELKKVLPLACAVEYIHTYSLIHDDLPCMDDDDIRRGKPSCHKMFGEANALLAGDALLNHSFDLISSCELESDIKCDAISLLSQNAGVSGMIGGQILDITNEENRTLSDILTIDKLKTGALISAACILGTLAGKATKEQISAASSFGYYLGMAFQIKDDILDVVGNQEKLGKPIGSDDKNNKVTYVSLNGINKAQEDVERLTKNAFSCLEQFDNSEFIKELAIRLINREK